MVRKSEKRRTPKTRSTEYPPRANSYDTKPHRPWQNLTFDPRKPDPQFPNVPVQWLIRSLGWTLFAVAACTWLLICFLFWQGSWQLLYHPSRKILATPQSSSIPFQIIHFDASETGVTQLTAWWIPADNTIPQTAILVLHGANGNVGDTLALDRWLHALHQSVFALDYRGYGASANGKPSEKAFLQDAQHALLWLSATKHIPENNIVLWGRGLGGEIAVELAVNHPGVAGVVLDQPDVHPLDAVLGDPRSHLVPARWLLQDRYNLSASARELKIPSLWLLADSAPPPDAYRSDPAAKTVFPLRMPVETDPQANDELLRWISGLPSFAQHLSH